MPSPQTKPSAANRPIPAAGPHDPDMQLVLRRLRDLYAQRLHWQQGKNMALLIRPYSTVEISLDPVESLVVNCEEPEAHLLSVPLNALIDHYEQVLWLAKIPLPSL
ncbi:hypothetical protein [Fibrella forsythiae]|uniref:Uncharacterized protein n=1 Tax=Fibrella forsythiae TaxID=2817061 RepID=A0ABS3JST7_9BACT|nr:hypothetical protein [Fibrella forsythiae]MBO0953085.1 hypothetical protein [Fibrella forsythiae]